jgi:hypothetical protein
VIGSDPVSKSVEFARDWKLLPQPYLYGFAHIAHTTVSRPAFLLGEVKTTGWWYFFPYACLIKTPLSTLAILVAAATVVAIRWFRLPRDRSISWLYRTAPLLTLLGVYWIFSLRSHINIGHRHILPTYAAMMILAGAASYWLRRPGWVKKAIVGLCLAGLVVESWSIRPHYLAFFNQLIGGPGHAYKHLVDSSLDWGQDLPGLRRWLDTQRAAGYEGEVYLSYFGSGSPIYYGISAARLPSSLDLEPSAERYLLSGGIYCISATMLQNVYAPQKLRGPWTPRLEAVYRETRAKLLSGFSSDRLWKLYKWLQLGKLTAYLREREPDHQVGYSILIYHLSDEEVATSLNRPLEATKPNPP